MSTHSFTQRLLLKNGFNGFEMKTLERLIYYIEQNNGERAIRETKLLSMLKDVQREHEEELRQVKSVDLADVVCWADMNEETPNLGELILVRFPPEQTTKPFIVEFDERFEWIDGTQYIRI